MVTITGVLFAITLLCGSLAIPTPEASSDVTPFLYHTDPSARIVGGTPALAGSVPYMGALSTGQYIRSLFCGSSIITERVILTAAHCIAAVFSSISGLSSTVQVSVGSNIWSSGGVLYPIIRNISHPHYVSATIKNDIGIFITAQPIQFSPTIGTVPLSYDFVPGGVQARAAGWGRIFANGPISSNLLELQVEIIDGQQCVQAAIQASIDLNMSAPPVDPELEICTYHSPGHGMCNGDSGSALVSVATGEEVALVSWGFPCARGAPDMFVRISAYEDWLRLAINSV